MAAFPRSFDPARIVAELAEKLSEMGVANPHAEARALAQLALRRHPDGNESALRLSLEGMLAERRQHRTLVRIAGEMNFYGMQLRIAEGVYEPCASSVRLIDHALEWIGERSRRSVRVLDVGTGIGNLLLAVVRSLPRAIGVGVDTNPRAIAVARSNAKDCGLASCCTFIEGDIHELGLANFDLVLSTLPWLPTSTLVDLMPEVRLHDPIVALDGGRDGLRHFRLLARSLDRLLAGDGAAFVQVGYEYVDAAQSVLRTCGAIVTKLRDIYGFPMGLCIQRRYY
jgi:release factor glutamine methyltransferase